MQLFAPNRSYLAYVIWKFCEFFVRIPYISYSASEYDLVYGNLFLTASRVKTGFIVYGTQPIRIQNSLFPFFLFLAIEGGGREAYRNPSFSALLFSFFPSRVYCHVLFHTGLCSAARNWRELYKNLTVLSSLEAYTWRTRFNWKNQCLSYEFRYFY